ncbi:membrane protein [Verrucomicrobiota bacterium]|nr:membrane protein [Verrucomicrobiota bacterium]
MSFPSPCSPRLSRLHALAALACLATLWLLGCAPQRDTAVGVKLLPESLIPSPNTTFELRFDEPMVTATNLGSPLNVSPLAIRPALAGQFTWLSPRTGVFTPTEPPVLGETYHFSLLPGLRNATGQPATARLHRRLTTPPLEISSQFSPIAGANISATPKLRLHFNSSVDPATAATFIEFRNTNGLVHPARVATPSTASDYNPNFCSYEKHYPTWREQFEFRAAAPAPAFQALHHGKTTSVTPRESTGLELAENLLHITPATPLPVGQGWRLVVKRGLPASDSRAQLTADFSAPLGDVEPFVVTDSSPHNRLSRGKTLELIFRKSLAPSLNATNALAWITLTPPPTKLTAEVRRDKIILHAPFALGTNYALRVAPGLPSADGHPLAETHTNTIRFEPMPPRLYFKTFREEQLSAGRRQLDLLTVNVPAYRLRARQLDRHTLIHALRGYGSYYAENNRFGGSRRDHFRGDLWFDGDEPYREIDFNVIPGKVILNRTEKVRAGLDEPRTHTLAWDDIAGKNARGAFFLAAELAPSHNEPRARVGTQTLVQLTDLGLVWKRGQTETLVYVFSYATGRPVADATVRVLTDDNETVQEQTTDEQGLATLNAHDRGQWLIAEKDGDLHALSLDHHEHEFSLWGFNLPLATNDAQKNNRRAFLFTDRPVYRPAETVHLKAIVRQVGPNSIRFPKPGRVTLTAFDHQNNPFFTTNTALSDLGSLAASFALPAGVLGGCRVELTLGQQTFPLAFEVQEFEPPAFEVAFHARPEYRATDPLEVPLRAQYFLGKPLARARARWTLTATDERFTPAGIDDFLFGNHAENFRGDLDQRDSTLTLQGDEPLSATGELKLQPAIPINPRAPQARTVHLHAEVTDANQQTIATAATFVRHSSDFYLGIREFKGVLRAGQPLPVEVIAVRTDGQPTPEPVPARATLTRIEWQTVRIEGAGGTRAYRSEPVRKEIKTFDLTTTPLVRRGDHWETPIESPSAPADPSAPAAPPPIRNSKLETRNSLTAPEPGLYFLEVSAKDSAGQRVQTTVSFNVGGAKELAWDYRNELQIDLVPDRKTYRVGETAEILVKTPISGPALITIERDNVRRSYVTNLVGNAPILSVPILSGDAPNVFVSVLLTRGLTDSRREIKQPEQRLGYCQLLVETVRSRLAVAVSTPAADYEPGQPIAITATVSDHAKKPVPGAEVTLYAVDDAILSLMGGRAPEPYPFFHTPHPLGTRTSASITTLFTENPDELGFFNKGYLVGGGGDAANRLRKDFPACPLWLAAVLTDADGKITATFPAPDALTRYRIIAVAHADKDRFGHGQSTVQINKPLMLQPSPPRFANVGDRLLARAVVLNNTTNAGEVEVTLQLDATASAASSATPSTNLVLKTKVAARGSTTLDFPVAFREIGEARWIWSARFADAAPGKFADRVQSTFPVRHPAPLLHEVLGGVFSNSVPNLLADADPQLLAGHGTINVRVSNTRLSELEWAAEHLLHYPYGCIEQTTSSLLPWLLLRDVTDVLPQLRHSPAQFNAAIQAGIARLFSMQTSSGGLSYWPGQLGDPQLWGSAYGGLALALAKRQGVTVPSAPFEKLLAYLSQSLRPADAQKAASASSPNASAHHAETPLVLLTLALARQPEPAYHELLFQSRATLSAENRALLALAILEAKGSRDMATELLNFKTDDKPHPGEWFGSASRDAAVRLLAWCRLAPTNPAVARHLAQLLHGRRAGHWTTTQGNAWALFALTEYARRVEGNLQPASGSVTFGDRALPFDLAAKPAVFHHTLTFTATNAATALKLTNAGRTPLYTHIQLAARSPAIQQPRQDRGFSIRRTYQRLNDQDELTTLDGLRVGDRVVVTLDLEAREAAHYVAIDDPLPALLEALHPEFVTQKTTVNIGSDGWWSDHHELRTDRALFFRNELAAGRHTIRYLARVRTAGTATAPSTKIEEMYAPDRHGLTETQTLTSLPLE